LFQKNDEQMTDFEHINEGQERRSEKDTDLYFNSQFAAKPFYIEPGHFFCGENKGEMVIATLGTGIAVTIHDQELGIGGMAYVLVPDFVIDMFPDFDRLEESLVQKICKPINDCIRDLKRLGAGKGRIRIRLIGGSGMPGDTMDRGTKNYIFVKSYFAKKGLSAMSEDYAGSYIRRVHFFPSTGRAVRRILRRESDFASIHAHELNFYNNFET